ncbi:MAG: methionyl-tRNA formyltransferase [Burkholderiales bacterium]|nr:methionyl-tRNA formyltransferase [Burkholderiales bacterium]
MRVAFAGTPEFAAVALRDLLAAGFELPLVLTQPDRPAGRGLQVQPSAVKRVAVAHGLPLTQPRGLRLDGRWRDDAAAACEALRRTGPDVLVVAAYGLILPQWLLDLPPLGCVNIHASLLPRWRGAAPIHRAIEAGDGETGISIMRMDAGLDTGAVYRMQDMPIAPDDTTASLHDKLAALGGRLLLQTLADLQAGVAEPTAQPVGDATYAAKIDKREAWLDWSLPADVLERRIRAFQPAPGTQTRWGEMALKILAAKVLPPDPAGHQPGTVLAAHAQGVDVACGTGCLRLTRLQKPGGKPQDASLVLQSVMVQVGQVFASGPPPEAGAQASSTPPHPTA